MSHLLKELNKNKIVTFIIWFLIAFKDFGGNKYSKNSWIMYIINDKFWWLY